MEILQICPYPFGEIGGVANHILNISKRLAKTHNVTVYATSVRPKSYHYELGNGIIVETFKCYAPYNAYFFSWDMLIRLRKAKFDIVHAHDYSTFPFHFSVLAKCQKLIVTTHFHGESSSSFRNSLRRLLKPFGKRTLKKAERIIAVSEFEKSLLTRHLKIDAEKITVIPNGVDFSEFSGLRRRPHDFKSILYVGYLLDYKGVQYLVEVLPKLADDVVLEIVGTGPIKPFLERRARELKVYDRVRFYENLSRRKLLQKFVDADVFVLLSKYEAYSLVVAEALTAGTPCIVANTSALSEWVDNESCFGVDFPISLDELARLINSVLDNGADKRAMKKWIGTKIPDWNNVAYELESIYLKSEDH